MKKIVTILVLSGLVTSLLSCTSKPPAVCDCAGNSIRNKTGGYDRELQKQCDDHYNSLSTSEKDAWDIEVKACLEKDPYYKKLQAEKKKQYYQSKEYLYGTWICVASGIGMRMKMMQSNTYFWQDDLNGFSTGTWEGTNSSLTFYEKGFPTGSGYIDANGKMIHKVAGITLEFSKE